MKLIYGILSVGLLISCNSQTEETAKKELQPSDVKSTSATNCYRYATEADTITLKLIHAGESITGTLDYQLKEKDSNKGTIQGVMKNNVLIADYMFMSEGIQSIRQVAFKLDGSTFIEGYGEIVEQDGRFKFKNSDSLKFSSSIKLSEISCQ